ncbi:PIN domain-containing protein [Hornefia butyriciproducens]|nr:PIN domain-containing protein [Hornefia butyriciproducens]MCI7327288.1 PIN domain-containing protein [Clostridiales bacterium]MCI7412636.1 PIN domain-containing protein [Clostridiales bacterium]MCI7680462.1 PIN domain-containing protein [Clostridiales bacterium]MDD6299424.1 PIN domain-containing protein [Hornefia butyriciproducens]MDD7019599.1 PIN domain-containing protein [Hornefia butyriciproducens]
MMIYLIDFENVSNGGFNGIENLTEKDEIKLFYSEKRSTISIGVHRKLEGSRAKKEYLPIKTGGKNALDFQLVTWLGYMIARNENAEYCIVSNDTGFDYAIDFWEKRGARVMRSADLNGVQMKHMREKLKELLPAETRDEADRIMELISKYKTKQGINNALVKKYGSEDAGVIYKSIRPMLAGKKGK